VHGIFFSDVNIEMSNKRIVIRYTKIISFLPFQEQGRNHYLPMAMERKENVLENRRAGALAIFSCHPF
jgi:hypothetical protein